MEKFNFSKKRVKQSFRLKTWNLSRSQMTKWTFTVEIVSRNLVTQSNFIGFRDSRNFMFFKAPGVVGDT